MSEELPLEIVKAWCSAMSESEDPSEGDMQRLVAHLKAALLPAAVLQAEHELERCGVCEELMGGPHADHCVTDEAYLWAAIETEAFGIYTGREVATRFVKMRSELLALREAWREVPPHYMRLHCPECGKLHLDSGEFATRVHRKHLCENTPEGPKTGCGHLWVPYPYATRGVAELMTDVLDEELQLADDALREAGIDPEPGLVLGINQLRGELAHEKATTRLLVQHATKRDSEHDSTLGECGTLRKQVEKLTGELTLARSSVGTAKLEGEVERLTAQRDRAYVLLRELGVSVMP